MWSTSLEHVRIVHMRKSVATWSFLLRPVCNLPATEPMISVNLRSTAVCISSSLSSNINFLSANSKRIFSKPFRIVLASEFESTPACSRPFVQVQLAVMSSSYNRLSNSKLELNICTSLSVDLLKRPPHNCMAILRYVL